MVLQIVLAGFSYFSSPSISNPVHPNEASIRESPSNELVGVSFPTICWASFANPLQHFNLQW